ncbi:hypothetical protein F0562_025512 [Nyssa sinensis]|uniref:Uncharacterized protein n=1 Tax=Nyssa sinensis TaxID=561372 RepID=A0A5J5B8M8_9ASTE|nr:hypothetical protein F0562_025512 [Nyssa sinensis]
MKELMVMVRPEEAPLSSTISIVDQFSSSVPPLIGVTKKKATQGLDDSMGKNILIKRVPQPVVVPCPSTEVVIHEPEANPSTFPFNSTSLFVCRSSRGLDVAIGASHSFASKEFPFLLSNQRVAVAAIRLFQTPIDMVKLAVTEFPSLEHQVCYNFMRVMETFFEKDNAARLAREKDALKITLEESNSEYATSCDALETVVTRNDTDSTFCPAEEAND